MNGAPGFGYGWKGADHMGGGGCRGPSALTMTSRTDNGSSKSKARRDRMRPTARSFRSQKGDRVATVSGKDNRKDKISGWAE
jgi:hypothetical protein